MTNSITNAVFYVNMNNKTKDGPAARPFSFKKLQLALFRNFYHFLLLRNKKINDAYPKMVLARTKHEPYQYEGVRIVDLAEWLSNRSSQ